jgi:hypothetical protein
MAHRRMPCWFGVIADHLRPRLTKPLTQRSSIIPSGIVVCRYHGGGGRDETINLIIARVEGIGPVLPILEGGRCVCPFVSGLHRTQTVVAASGLFVRAGRSNLTPYLPPHSAASRIQMAYRSYVRWVSRHNNPTVSMLFARISVCILRNCCPFDCAVKSAYKQCIHWTRKEFDVNSIHNGLDYFHRQCDNRHIRMDVEPESLRGALDVLAWLYDTG